MMSKAVTIDQVMAWWPRKGYTREEVAEMLFGENESLTATARDIVALASDDGIAAADAAWALLHTEFLSETQMRFAACDIAEARLSIWEQQYPDDLRPRRAIEAGRAYARGEIDDDALAAAWYAARNAAKAACDDAAWAAWAASWSAARDAAKAAAMAAWDAAWDAARVAGGAWDARNPAWAAAWDTAWAEQLETLLRHIESKEVNDDG